MSFTPAFLDELRSRLVLSELVGRRVALKRKGNEYAGLCPFHNEKTPSFWVNDRKAFFHCFGCGAHGDAIGFAMRAEGLQFRDAVEKLAQEAGLALPVSSPEEREENRQRDDIRRAVELAAQWFQRQLRLPVGRDGLEYLHGRGLDDAAIARFGLGFAADNREGLTAHLRREGISLDTAVQAGLTIRPDDGRDCYDRFRGRVMFPIADRRGRCIAFGGRVIGSGEPKYLNSPETPLFHKGANLYCLHLAREAAYAGQPMIVAEGYMDAIALQLAGFAGAVAPLGTALTEGQMGELWKAVDEPLLCFDGDNAGRRAAFRAAERALPLLQPGKSLRFVSLPTGEDPDSLVRGQGREAMAALLAAARPLADIIWELETAGNPLDTPERQAKLRAALRKRSGEIRDETVRELYREALDRRARETFMPPRPATARRGPGLPRFGPPPPAGAFQSGTAVRRAAHDLDPSRRERILIGLAVVRPDLLADLVDDIARLELSRPELGRLRAALLEFVSDLHDEQRRPSGGGGSIDRPALAGHLQAAGLGAIAHTAAEEVEAWIAAAGEAGDPAALIERWRHTAALQHRIVGGPQDLRRAEQAWREDPSDENFEQLRAIKEQILRDRSLER